MKKSLAVFLAFLMFSTSTVFAFPLETVEFINDSMEEYSEFQLDEFAIEDEFAELNALESYLLNQEATEVAS